MSISPTTFGVSSIAPVQHQMSGPSRQIKRCEDQVYASCEKHRNKVLCCLATGIVTLAAAPSPHHVCSQSGGSDTKCTIPLATFSISRFPSCDGYVYKRSSENVTECDKNK